MVPRPVVTAAAPYLLLLSLSSPSDGSQLSATVGAASAFPAGVAAAHKSPSASNPRRGPWQGTSQGDHPEFWCDAAHGGVGEVRDLALAGSATACGTAIAELCPGQHFSRKSQA